MALVVEDGTGRADADAYVSVTDADAYLADYGTPASWSSATTTTKEEAIRRATRAMDALFGQRWKGVRKTQTQALDWPRIGGADDDGRLLPEMPAVLADACAILASRDVAGDDLVPDQPFGDQEIESEAVAVGSLRREVRYRAGKLAGKTYDLVMRMLDDLMVPMLGVRRG